MTKDWPVATGIRLWCILKIEPTTFATGGVRKEEEGCL